MRSTGLGRVVLAALLGYYVLLIAKVCTVHPQDGDFFWHTRMGQDLLLRGISPLVDHYSFTYPGQPIRAVPVGFQLLLASVQSLFGGGAGDFFGGQVLAAALRLSALLGLAIWAIRKGLPGFVVAFVALFVADGFIYNALIRPESTAFPLVVVLIALFEKSRQRGLSTGLWLALNAVLLAWVNIHASSAIGFVVLAGVYVHHGWLALRASEWRRLGGLVALSGVTFALGFVNPSWTHPVLFGATIDPAWSRAILEHIPQSFDSQRVAMRAFWVVWAGFGLFQLRRLEFGRALILAVIGFQTMSLTKMYPHLVLVTVTMMIADAHRVDWKGLFARRSVVYRGALAVACLGIYAFIVYEGHPIVWKLPRLTQVDPGMHPVRTVEYMKSRGIRGPVLNEHFAGGYLIYSMSPDVKVYIDGRTNILYPLQHMFDYFELGIDPGSMHRLIRERGVRHLVSTTYPDRSGLVTTGILSNAFDIEYSDTGHVLMSVPPTPFPASSKLFVKPECWSEELAKGVLLEQASAQRVLDSTSELYFLIQFVADYRASADGHRFLREVANYTWGSMKNDRTQRLAAYLAYKVHGDAMLALRYYEGISRKQNLDRFYISRILIGLKRFDLAEVSLMEVVEKEKMRSVTRGVGYEADTILKHLFDMGPQGERKLFDSALIKRLEIIQSEYLRQSQANPQLGKLVDASCRPNARAESGILGS